MRDGKVVFMLERRDIESHDAPAIANALTQAFDRFCSSTNCLSLQRVGTKFLLLQYAKVRAPPTSCQANVDIFQSRYDSRFLIGSPR